MVEKGEKPAAVIKLFCEFLEFIMTFKGKNTFI